VLERRLIRENEVYVVAEEGTHDERKCASGKREQEHVHRCHFVDRERVAKRKDESADAYDGGVGRQERNGGEKVQEGRVCSEADTFCTHPRTVVIHFEDTASALGAVVGALGFGPPANATPLSRLRVIVRRRRGEQRVFEAHLAGAHIVRHLLRLCLRDRSWVARDAGDERAEGEEGEGVDDEEVRDEEVRRV